MLQEQRHHVYNLQMCYTVKRRKTDPSPMYEYVTSNINVTLGGGNTTGRLVCIWEVNVNGFSGDVRDEIL